MFLEPVSVCSCFSAWHRCLRIPGGGRSSLGVEGITHCPLIPSLVVFNAVLTLIFFFFYVSFVPPWGSFRDLCPWWVL